MIKSTINELGFDSRKLVTYSSDLNCAQQTAKIICNEGSRLKLDARLREMSFGNNEGIPQEKHNELIRFPPKKGARLDHRICEGAESPRELATRVAEFVNSVIDCNEDIIIVAHGFSSSFVIAAFQQIAVESMAYIDYKLGSGSITILEVDDYFHNHAIKLLNYQPHNTYEPSACQ